MIVRQHFDSAQRQPQHFDSAQRQPRYSKEEFAVARRWDL